MNILFDINHPAHVHLFKNVILELEARGHSIWVTSREKDCTVELLDRYNIEHEVISSVGNSIPGLGVEFLKRELCLLKRVKSFEPDVLIGSNPAITHISYLLGGTSILANDSEPVVAKEKMSLPFVDIYLTPDCFARDVGEKQMRYSGYHELAYLHPDNFDPEPELLLEHGIDPNDKFFVVRFIDWGAHHDIGESGMSLDMKERVVEYLSNHGDVYITSEADLPQKLQKYQLPVPPHILHHLLYYANLYVGDSQTMASEAGVLGTPAVRSNTFSGESNLSYLKELEEEYDLIYSTTDEKDAYRKVKHIVESNSLEWDNKKRDLLEEKIDVSEYLLKLILQHNNK